MTEKLFIFAGLMASAGAILSGALILGVLLFGAIRAAYRSMRKPN